MFLLALMLPFFVNAQQIIPNDPEFSKLWGLKIINADKAWPVTTGSKDIIVAVIDSGIDFRIPDLVGQAWINEAEAKGKAGVDDDGNGYKDDINGYDFYNDTGKQIDNYGHGSHLAGIIGAKGNNGIGVTGVSWNVRLMALRATDDQGDGIIDIKIKAINYAVKMGARIINYSAGAQANYSLEMLKAIRIAGERGVLFVTAAGNESSNNDKEPMYPSSYRLPNMVSVAAINKTGQLTDFSNFGKYSVDLAAPGDNILSTVPKGYRVLRGTSMAVPYVVGVAALVLSKYPKLTVEELKDRILKTVSPRVELIEKIRTGGILNAYGALL